MSYFLLKILIATNCILPSNYPTLKAYLLQNHLKVYLLQNHLTVYL